MRCTHTTILRGIPAAILAALVLASCASAPVTGRNQLILISPQQSQALGVQAYQQIKQQTPIVTRTEQARIVERIGRRIAAIAPGTSGYAWEFNLFQDSSPNAFALPGGKVGVNTGLFDVAENEAQLAAVLAHEVGHVVAQHSAERMSRDMVAQLGIGALGAATSSPELVNLAASAATLGVTLPFTRSQEAEADHIGLIYMARAGYDPRAAVELWKNFQSAGGSRPPAFLSTHPSPENRIARLEELMPEAMQFYRGGGQRLTPPVR